MKGVQATAPGKIILFGEHAVVYGRPAIAVPVTEVRAKASLQASDSDFKIVASDLDRTYLLAEAEPDDPLATIVQITLKYLDQVAPEATLHITSTIPLGRGLGSGAAVSTATVRVLGQFFDNAFLPEEVSNLVYEVEKLYHGMPSGIDNTVVAFGQPVYFVKGKAIRRMQVQCPLTLVIGDTGLVSPTHRAVGDLRCRWQAEPERYEGYFDEIEVIVEQAKVAIEQGRLGLPAFGKLLNENQELLQALGVSSPELEQLIGAARRAGALGAKLSGAGWGGNMIALVPPQPEVISAVTKALIEAGATGVIVTELN
jgi:mevalonate kinase